MTESVEPREPSALRQLSVALFWGLVLSPVAIFIGIAFSPGVILLSQAGGDPAGLVEILKTFAPLALPGTLIVLPGASYLIKGKNKRARHRFIGVAALSGFVIPSVILLVVFRNGPAPVGPRHSLADTVWTGAFFLSMTGLPGAFSGGLTAALFFRVTRGRVRPDEADQ